MGQPAVSVNRGDSKTAVDPLSPAACKPSKVLATQRQVLGRIHRVMKDQGTLFVGHAENFSDARTLFALRGKTVYEKV